MKIVNLDKFAVRRQVEFEGKKYTVKGMSYEEYIALPETRTKTFLIEILTRLTDIPEAVLKKMDWRVLSVLFDLTQGIDPVEPKDDEDSPEGGEEPEKK